MDAGELVVKTVLDNSKFKKQYNDLEKQANQKKINIDVTTENIERLEKELEIAKQKQQELFKEYDEAVAKRNAVDPFEAFGNGVTGDELVYYDEVIENLEKKMKDALKPNVEDITKELEKQKNILAKQQEEYEKIKQKTQQIRLQETQDGLKNIKKGIGDTIKSIGKMGLAIFGIRSAYNLIRNAMTDISRYNSDVANTLTYARTMLTTALEPIIVRIVGWVKQLMIYINYLFKAWFKRDLFAETDKNLKNANKSAGTLKKTLAGFDEMNILNSSSSGGGGGVSFKDLKIPDMQGEVPKWLKTVEEVGKWVIDNWEDVVFGITLIKTAVDVLTGNWLGLIGDIIILSAIAIKQISEDFSKAFLEETAGIKSVEDAEKDLNETRKKLEDAKKEHNNLVKKSAELHKELAKAEKDAGITAEDLFKQIQDGKIAYHELTPEQQNVYDLYYQLNNTETQLAEKDKELIELKKQETKDSLELALANAKEKDSYDELKEAVVKAFNEGKIKADEARSYIERGLAGTKDSFKEAFTEDLPKAIKEGLNPNKYESVATKFKNWFKNLFGKLQLTFGITMSGGGGGSWAKGGIYYPQLPRLAVGGIVNQPGRGIPYHGAIIGERGAEGILPLTDSQQMELLGQAIGRYITINNTNPIYMNGRLIAKEINRSNAEDDFAFNR